MQKRIGILTFHSANNYGAVLQAYALKEVLQEVHPDKEVCVIDYRCAATVSLKKFSDIRRKKGLIKAVIHYPQLKKANKCFDKFRQEFLSLTKEYKSKEDIAKDIDQFEAIVSGSDQVWNQHWSGEDDVYFQGFHSRNDLKYSYAASFGVNQLDESQIAFYKQYLQEFKYISVRESSGIKIAEHQLGLRAIQHIDPTLLLGRDKWDEIAIKVTRFDYYILVYMVPKQRSVIQYALDLKRRTGLPIVMLSKNFRPINVRHLGHSSPLDFVGLFKNAEYVVTNSFHGTAFSIIYNRKFWVDLNTERGYNTRSESILRLCGLGEMIDCYGKVNVEIDNWDSVNEIVHKKRMEALDYLSTI